MSADRDLLVLAAMALGGVYMDGSEGQRGIITERYPYEWNPLADDGDALQLAVRLGIPINPNMRSNTAGACTRRYNFEERHNGDAFAATRRAIVRAAAKIGEGGDKA